MSCLVLTIMLPAPSVQAGRQHSQASSPIAMGGPYPGHDGYGMGGGGFGAGGLDGPHGRNAQVTIRLLVPLAAGKLLVVQGKVAFSCARTSKGIRKAKRTTACRGLYRIKMRTCEARELPR